MARLKKQANILAIYEAANEEELREGMSWYANAHADCLEISGNLKLAAGIVAAVSPGLRWEKNIEAARRIIDGTPLSGLGRIWGANKEKAMDILEGKDPEKVLGGNKVRAFYRLIVQPWNKEEVCVDGHAYCIWLGKKLPTDEIPQISNHTYACIWGDYVTVAGALGILPHQLQAVTWLTWRRIHGVTK